MQKKLTLDEFLRNYKSSFKAIYITERKPYYKDGYFYYQLITFLNRNGREIKWKFGKYLTYKDFFFQIRELVLANPDYFAAEFKDFDFGESRNFITYCWARVVVGKAKALIEQTFNQHYRMTQEKWMMDELKGRNKRKKKEEEEEEKEKVKRKGRRKRR